MVASLYDWLKFLHVVAAMVWVGGLVMLAVYGTYVRRRGDREALARFVGSLGVVGPIVLAPSAALVAVFGVWMVVDSEAWGFGQTWIWLALALLVAAALFGALFLSRRALAAERSLKEGELARAGRDLGRWSWGIATIVALLVLASWDMVFKPGL